MTRSSPRWRRSSGESRTRPLPEQIHVAWYTVRWSDRRFETGQEAFVRRLVELNLPVVFVLTQVPMNLHGQVHTDALALARHVESLGLPLSPRNHVYLTNALADDFLGTPVHGLQDLLDATFETAPEAVALALTAAQQIDLERKRQAARTIIRGATGAAMATGATPIPFSDAAILIPLQIAMIARISAAYGLSLPTDRTAGLVGSLMLSGGATTAGRWLVTSLLRVVPGGQPAAMVISASVAASLTGAMGWSWVTVCERILLRDPDGSGSVLDTDGLRALFQDEFRRRLRLGRDAAPPPMADRRPGHAACGAPCSRTTRWPCRARCRSP